VPQPPRNHLQGYGGRFRKSLLLIAVSLMALSLRGLAQEASAGDAGGPAGIDELKKELAVALDGLNKMQQELALICCWRLSLCWWASSTRGR
jgi:hypothetical protein